MRGDFSRDSFRPAAGFSRVLRQQGRIDLDADTNEAQSIQLRLLRTLAADLIGPYAAVGNGFSIASNDLRWDFLVGPGRYYIDGWLCENDAAVAWQGDGDHPRQPWTAEPPQPPQLRPGAYLAYLEVWERHVAALEHDGPLARAVPGALREVALGGVDTASRAQLVWQVRLAPVPDGQDAPTAPMSDDRWLDWESRLRGAPQRAPVLKVKAAEPGAGDPDPCLVPPRAAYRGQENHLYRVEICRSGPAARSGSAPGRAARGQIVPGRLEGVIVNEVRSADSDRRSATFVWSRDNGSVLAAVESIDGAEVRLATGWRDSASAIGIGDHVEISSPAIRLDPGPGPIRRVDGYDPDSLTLTLDSAPGIEAAGVSDGVVVRRWDHVEAKAETGIPPIADDHALTLIEGRWLTLEDGISIYFGEEPQPGQAPGQKLAETHYRSGDYWLFEARVDFGDVIWPRTDSNPPQPLSMPSNGVERRLAPLAAVTFADNGTATVVDLRRRIQPIHEP